MEKRVVFKSWWLPLLLVAPQMAVTLVFFIWPAGQALYGSAFVEDAFGTSSEFVGAQNFQALFADPLYGHAFGVTALFSVCVAALALSVSLLLAVFANRVFTGARAYQTLLIWPYAVAPAIAGILWLFMFDPSVGVAAWGLKQMGVNWNHLLNGRQAMLLVILAAAWKQVSYNFIFFLAGLTAIPKSLVEAAAIDGAGPGRRFIDIVFPLLTPTTFFLLVVNVIYAFFDTFGVIDAVTQGGPSKATEVLVYKIFQDGFKGQDYGGAAAQSVILMIIVVALTVAQFRYIDKKVQY
jgi:sn-glycerol 3-phosphate transport system permease protein